MACRVDQNHGAQMSGVTVFEGGNFLLQHQNDSTDFIGCKLGGLCLL